MHQLPSPWFSYVVWRCGSLTSGVSCKAQMPPWPKPAAPEWREPAEVSNTLLLLHPRGRKLHVSAGILCAFVCVYRHSHRHPGAVTAQRELHTATASSAGGLSAAPSCRTGGCGQTGMLPAPLGFEGGWRTCRCSLLPVYEINSFKCKQTPICKPIYCLIMISSIIKQCNYCNSAIIFFFPAVTSQLTRSEFFFVFVLLLSMSGDHPSIYKVLKHHCTWILDYNLKLFIIQ